MKPVFISVAAILLVACSQGTPTLRPKATPTNFLTGKPTLTEAVIELPKPQQTPPIRRTVLMQHAMFRELPQDAESATFPRLPVETPDPRTRPATRRVNAIVWDLLSGSFYTSEVASGAVPASGWTGPGFLGTTQENIRRVMVCVTRCNQWPVPMNANIQISSFPPQARNATYEQPWWAKKQEADFTLEDGLVLDITGDTAERYSYQFSRDVRNGIGTGWAFGPIQSESGVRVIGLCFDRCNELPAPKP